MTCGQFRDMLSNFPGVTTAGMSGIGGPGSSLASRVTPECQASIPSKRKQQIETQFCRKRFIGTQTAVKSYLHTRSGLQLFTLYFSILHSCRYSVRHLVPMSFMNDRVSRVDSYTKGLTLLPRSR